MQLRLPDRFDPAPVALFMDDAAFHRALSERVGRKQPRVQRRSVRTQDTQIGFGPIVGKAGQQHTATHQSMSLFRGEKLISIDDASPPGSGTRIVGMFVGNLNQFPTAPGGGGISSMMFAPNALGNGIALSSAQAGIPITIQVAFDKDCTWHGALFGKCIL